MTQQFFHGHDVRSRIQQVSGKSVSQRVRMGFRFVRNLQQILSQYQRHLLACKWPSLRFKKKVRVVRNGNRRFRLSR